MNDNEKTFTAQLGMILKNDYGYENIEVVNAGVGGYNSWESLINLEFRVLDIDPDLVVIYHGTNDVHARLVDPAAYRGDNSGRRQQWRDPPPPSTWERSTLARILGRRLGFTHQVGLGLVVNAPTSESWMPRRASYRGADPIEVLKMKPPVYFERNLRNMIAVAKEIMFATWAHSPYFDDYAATPHYDVGFEENNDVVKDVAERYKIPMFDFASVMPEDPRIWSDGCHVNEAGALVKARLFANFIHEAGLIESQPTSALTLVGE